MNKSKIIENLIWKPGVRPISFKNHDEMNSFFESYVTSTYLRRTTWIKLNYLEIKIDFRDSHLCERNTCFTIQTKIFQELSNLKLWKKLKWNLIRNICYYHLCFKAINTISEKEIKQLMDSFIFKYLRSYMTSVIKL